MFRHRPRPAVPPLDEATAEQLLDGRLRAPAPAAYRPVADLLSAATAPPSAHELSGAAAAAASFVAAHAAATRPQRRPRPVLALAVTGFLFAASTGTAVAATEGALPQPVQAVAHDALGVVGISVPGVTPEHADPVITATLEGQDPGTASSGTPGLGGSEGTPAGAASAGGAAVGAAASAASTEHKDSSTDATGVDDPAATPADEPSDDPQVSEPGHEPRPAPEPKTPRSEPEPRPAPEPRDPRPAPGGKDDAKGPR